MAVLRTVMLAVHHLLEQTSAKVPLVGHGFDLASWCSLMNGRQATFYVRARKCYVELVRERTSRRRRRAASSVGLRPGSAKG